ncbi:MAG: phosphate ABC transporter substrate-binding/OmpA family protein [Gemmobacter sp.]
MRGVWRVAALMALVWAGQARCQDATLTALDGGLSLSGDLVGFDGEFYRLDTAYGVLTVDAAGVLCEGPACPDLSAPFAAIRITGAAEPALALLPRLVAAFAASRGLTYRQDGAAGFAATIANPSTREALGTFTFAPAAPAEAILRVDEGRADLVVAALSDDGMAARVLANEALVVLVATDNPLTQVRSTDLARALTGEVKNWQDLGGPDMPIVLHALSPEVALQGAVAARLGGDMPAEVRHPDATALAAAVARDPWALALSGRADIGPARVLPLTDSCDFPLPVTALTVKAGDYPLSVPLYLMAPRRRMPLITREFLEFLATDAAQSVIAAAGYIDRRPTRAPLTGDGQRLLGAIRSAGPEVSLPELQRLAAAMTGGERLSLTFRFEDGSTQLDAASQDNLAQLARLIGARAFDGFALSLAGFSDGSGEAATNLALSRTRAEAVRASLARIAPDLRDDELPTVDAFGEALPMACDSTPSGRHINRRVELWLHPLPDWDGPPPAPSALADENTDPAIAATPEAQTP